MIRFRIIPATITVAMMLLGVKIVDVMHGAEALAEQTNPPPEKKEIPKAADKAAAPAGAEKEKAEGGKEADKPGEGKDKEEKKADSKKDKDDDKKSALSETAGDIVDHRFTPVEVELLQNLTKRREELDRWEKNIEIKEAALDATEKRLDDKIAQIDAMKKEVSGLLAQYNEKEDGKIRSLVKIYENMKPKDAARIFDEVEMPILLIVIDKMSEKKIAPILAEMDPKKAKTITVQLAEQRRVSTAKLNLPGSTAPSTQAQ